MNQQFRDKIISVCDDKIEKKGANVGLSFYALLMEAATWWIKTHELDHFEKAVKIRQMVLDGL